LHENNNDRSSLIALTQGICKLLRIPTVFLFKENLPAIVTIQMIHVLESETTFHWVCGLLERTLEWKYFSKLQRRKTHRLIYCTADKRIWLHYDSDSLKIKFSSILPEQK